VRVHHDGMYQVKMSGQKWRIIYMDEFVDDEMLHSVLDFDG